MLHSSEILSLKTRPLKILHDFFLITPGNSALFLINSQEIHLLFLQYLWKFYILNLPPICFFSGIAQSSEGEIWKIKKRGESMVQGKVFLKGGFFTFPI